MGGDAAAGGGSSVPAAVRGVSAGGDDATGNALGARGEGHGDEGAGSGVKFDAGIGGLEGADGGTGAVGDGGERLAGFDAVEAPGGAVLDGDLCESRGEVVRAALRDLERIAVGGDVADEGGVEVLEFCDGDAESVGDEGEAGGALHGDGVEGFGGVGDDAIKAVVFRVFRHDGHGEDEGDVVGSFLGQDVEALEFPEVGVSGAFDGVIDAAGAAVIGGHGEVPVAEVFVEVVEVVGGGLGGFDGVHALVVIGGLVEAVFAAAELGELPEADAGFIGPGARQEAGLVLGEVDEFLWDAFLGEGLFDHATVAAGAAEAGFEDFVAAIGGEVMDEAEDGVSEFEGELGSGATEFAGDLGFKGGVDGEGHVEDAFERGLVVDDLAGGLAGAEALGVEAIDGFGELIGFAFEALAVGGVGGGGEEGFDSTVEFGASVGGVAGIVEIAAAAVVFVGLAEAQVGEAGERRDGGEEVYRFMGIEAAGSGEGGGSGVGGGCGEGGWGRREERVCEFCIRRGVGRGATSQHQGQGDGGRQGHESVVDDHDFWVTWVLSHRKLKLYNNGPARVNRGSYDFPLLTRGALDRTSVFSDMSFGRLYGFS